MNNNNIFLCSLVALVLSFGSCTKADSYKPTASFSFSSDDKFTTTDVALNPKDSVRFHYTATATAGMSKILLKKGLSVTDTIIIPAGSEQAYSGIKRAVADSVPGLYNYSFSAYDAAGVIMGTQSILVTVNADFDYFTNRKLFVPDTTAKTNPTYFASATGSVFSYSGIGSNAANVDFGYYYDTTTANHHTVYGLTSNPVSFYDLSTWTKNATVFKLAPAAAKITMATLNSGGALKTAGVTNLASGTSSKIGALVQGNIVLFKTAAGKYGAFLVGYAGINSPAATTYMVIDVKIQR